MDEFAQRNRQLLAMVDQDDEAEMAQMTEWTQQAAAALDVEPLTRDDLHVVLSASRLASSELVRPAGPVVMYLAGVLVASGHADDVVSACRIVATRMGIPGLLAHLNELEHGPQGIGD